ncbi:hypothetical protein EJB05_00866, partial [Eragrostis curvula]
MDLIAGANLEPQKLPPALMSFGVVISTAALALIIFKPPGGIFLRLHGSAPWFVYYGILIALVTFGLAVMSFGFWVVPPVDGANGWHGACCKAALWASVVALVLVAALGGLAFVN